MGNRSVVVSSCQQLSAVVSSLYSNPTTPIYFLTLQDIALDAKSSSALSTGSKWSSGTTFVEQSKTTGHVPFTNIAATVPVTINVRSSVGPVMKGIQVRATCCCCWCCCCCCCLAAWGNLFVTHVCCF